MSHSIIIASHIVTTPFSPKRLSDYLPDIFYHLIPSKKGLKKAIKKGLLKVNGEVQNTAYWVQAGDKIELLYDERPQQKILKLPLSVLYEDEHLAVVEKPSGIPVSGNQFRTFNNALLYSIQKSNLKTRLAVPRAVHRIDALTRGLIIVAKTYPIMVALGKQFQNRKVFKKYKAIVKGYLPDKQKTIDIPLEGKAALTHFEVEVEQEHRKWGKISLLDIKIDTGRTHQIRKHLSQQGYPVLGDELYDLDNKMKSGGLYLMAYLLAFYHPIEKASILIKLERKGKFKKIFR